MKGVRDGFGEESGAEPAECLSCSRTLCKSSKRWEPRVGMLAHAIQSLRGPASTRHRSFSRQGSQALGYKLAITPVWVVLFTAPGFFVSVKLCLSSILQFALRTDNLPGQKNIHSSPTSLSGPFNWGCMTVWLVKDNGLCVPPNVNPEKCHTRQFLKTCLLSILRRGHTLHFITPSCWSEWAVPLSCTPWIARVHWGSAFCI